MGCLGSRAGTSSRDAAFAATAVVLATTVRGAGAAFRAAAGLFGAVVPAEAACAADAFVAAVVCEAARDGEMTGSRITQARNAMARWRRRIIIIPPETKKYSSGKR